MILRGIAAPSIFSQTIRYSKVSLDLAKKSTLYGKKNRFCLTLVVCSHHFRGYSCNLAIIEGLTKKTLIRKRIAVHFVMMCTSAS